MSIIIIDTKDLRTLLERFASDLVNYCARVENGEIKLPEKDYRNILEGTCEMIASYQENKDQEQL